MSRKNMKQGQQEVYQGGTKKFLYSGSKSKGREDGDSWSFTPKTGPSNPSFPAVSTGSGFDLDDVWSIKKNVALNKSKQKTDHLNLNVNSNFYSRHGGLKDKEDVGFSMDRVNPSLSATGGSRSWTSGRQGFSYSYGANGNQGNKVLQSPPTNSQRLGLTTRQSDNLNGSNGVLGGPSVTSKRNSSSSQNSDMFRF